MVDIKVSVIIPTYKRSQVLNRAVDSVLAQSIDSFEVIVVDDNGVGTDDGEKTSNVMIQYKEDNRVIYLRHEVNKNGSAARNTGLQVARGKYIAFLDDDDSFTPDRLQLMYDKLESLDDSWGACYSSYVKHQIDGTKQYSGERVEGDIFLQALMRSFYLGSGSNLFFRNSVIKDVGFFDENFKRNQDLEYLVRVAKKYKMAYVDNVLLEIYYDVRTVSLTYEQTLARELLFRNSFKHHLEQLPGKAKKEIVIMYDIDWIRYLLSNSFVFKAIKYIIQAKIPVYVYIRYFKYIIDRKRNSLSYGFIVKLKK